MLVNDNTFHKSYRHKSDELGIIISGSLYMEVKNESYVLKEGDTIYIPAGYDHGFKKISTEECVSYWLSSNTKDVTEHLHKDKENTSEN